MKKNLLFLLCVSGMLFSCTIDDVSYSFDQTKSNVMDSGAYVSVLDTCTIVDVKKAKYVAQLFQKKDSFSRSIDVEKRIEKVDVVKDENGIALLYIVNYKNEEGFVIVSATQNYPPVLAYSDKGTFDLSVINSSGVSVWLSEQKKIIGTVNELPDSIKQVYRALWLDYNIQKEKVIKARSSDDVQFLISNSIRQWEMEGYVVFRFSDIKDTPLFENLPIDVKTEVHNAVDSADPRYGGRGNVTFILHKEDYTDGRISPLLQTKWAQRSGYNACTPHNYPVGCVAVAMGQIMKFHEYPVRYDWNSMYNTEATATTAAFLAEIGSNVGMDYEADGSESNIDKALSAFKNKYGYVLAVKKDHSVSNVIKELKHFRPVYMRGYDSSGFLGVVRKGHAWVCDGYSYSTVRNKIVIAILEDTSYNGSEPTEMSYVYTDYELKASSEFFHMNWGWGGEHDGFYMDNNLWINDFSDGPLNLAHGRSEIINLYPLN